MTTSNTRQQPLCIGVTGHRILAAVDKINAGIDAGLIRIAQAFAGRRLVAVSPLAEGADRLVATRVLARRGGRLIAPLPLAQDDYMQDFATGESKAEFMRLVRQAEQVVLLDAKPTRNEAYEAVGLYVLDHCDVLIAIWDGQGAQGQGGTGDIVARARARGLPLVWVHAGNRKPGTTEPTTLGDEQGMVTYERL